MSDKILIVSGPSGVGKDTVVDAFCEKYSKFEKCISCTSRKPRRGEIDGQDYYFVSDDFFDDSSLFLEKASVHGHMYGTLRSEIERIIKCGNIPLLVIDAVGAQNLRNNGISNCSLFIKPPSLEQLSSQLKNRGTESEEDVSLRLTNAIAELEKADDYDFQVVNDDVDICVNQIADIVDKAFDLKK